MKTRAAVLYGVGEEWQVKEVELDGPKTGEVLVKSHAAGLCHSDEHLLTGDMFSSDPENSIFPCIGGHEGSGVVIEVGDGVTDFEVGDHVAVSFVPACGKCRWCASGMQNLCDQGMGTLGRGMITDGRSAHHDPDGEAIYCMAKLGTFAEHMLLGQDSLVKVDKDLDLVPVALVSCGVATGYGSAVNRAEVTAGDTVVVVGCGGIGSNALQGAKLAGAKNVVAVDPAEFKREKASEFGATHTASSMEEAMELVGGLTAGVMADKVILSPGVVTGDMIAPAQFLTRKGGTIVVTGLAPMAQMDVQLNLFEFAMMNKEIKGTIYGSDSPRHAVPRLLSMYQAGQLKLDELVTQTYTLDQINEGYQDMRDDKNIRGVIVFD
ncbi:MAG: NDMA-dependent alcohol dehydrogenase [Acidimicrobiales bacterium]|nr:NDMA-dependent alcohol dehydrogenase [Acidimicrobiales bacterium]